MTLQVREQTDDAVRDVPDELGVIAAVKALEHLELCQPHFRWEGGWVQGLISVMAALKGRFSKTP